MGMVASPEFPEWVLAVEAMVKKTAARILSQDFTVMGKGRQDIVTGLDYAMEREIKRQLHEMFPNDRFIGEEENQGTPGPERTWVCDPIDGTVNFVMELPYFGVTLALLENTVPVFSLIHLPKLDETYMAMRGKGAYLNGTRLVSHPDRQLAQSIVTFGDFSKSNPTSRPFQIRAMQNLMEEALRVRIQGASSVDFAFLAAGRNGCHILFSSSVWEVVPGTLMAEEAGCAMTSLSGQSYGFQRNAWVFAVNPTLLDQVTRALDSCWRV